MKKLLIMCTIAMTILLSACAQTVQPIAKLPSAAVAAESSSIQENPRQPKEETTETCSQLATADSSLEDESSNIVVPAEPTSVSTDISTPDILEDAAVETTGTVVPETTPVFETSALVSEPKETEITPVSENTGDSMSPPNPAPEVPPPAEETPAPYFDISQYVSFAMSCGQSKGLVLDSTAVSCWDDPIRANANCIYLERDINDRFSWYVDCGYSAFWVWSEDLGGGNYLLYIGYA